MPEVKVVSVQSVEDFPGRTDLNVNRLSNGAVCVSNKDTDGGPSRYSVGDLVIHVPEGLVAPEWILKRQGCWNDAKNKGTLKGSKGNRTTNRGFSVTEDTSILSEGMILACKNRGSWVYADVPTDNGTQDLVVEEGQDVKGALGFSDYNA